MLKDTFFTILSSGNGGNGRVYRIRLNCSHPIFQAHFAGNPIMPGACIVQLIKELASDCFEREFFIGAVKNMKFLQPINPLESPEIAVQLGLIKQEEERITLSVILNESDRIFVKSTLLLETVNDKLRCATERNETK